MELNDTEKKVFNYIKKNKPNSQTQIANALGFDKGWIHQVLRKMERNDVIEYSPAEWRIK